MNVERNKKIVKPFYKIKSKKYNIFCILKIITLASFEFLNINYVLANPTSNWLQTRDYAMTLREAGRPIEAYNLIANYKPVNSVEETDRTFTAGFLALRALNRTDLALNAFQNMAISTQNLKDKEYTDRIKSMAGYWLGRTLQQMGKDEESKQLFKTAALYRNTYYGYLSSAQIGLSDNKIAINPFKNEYPNPDFYWHDPRVKKELILAIIKAESDFKTSTVSSAGAVGDMQIMPETVKDLSKQTGIQLDMYMTANNRDYNVIIGSRHFADFFTQYNGNIVLACAAYNAGPKPVDDWIKRFGDPRIGQIDPVDWIELIPYRETRNYVKKVIANYISYSLIYN